MVKRTCVRLELHFITLNLVECVAEWTERRRVSPNIQVRLPSQSGRLWLQKCLTLVQIEGQQYRITKKTF